MLCPVRGRTAGGADSDVAERLAEHRYVVAGGKSDGHDLVAPAERVAGNDAPVLQLDHVCKSFGGCARSTESVSICAAEKSSGSSAPRFRQDHRAQPRLRRDCADSGMINSTDARSPCWPCIALRSAGSTHLSARARSRCVDLPGEVIAGMAFHAPPLWGAQADAKPAHCSAVSAWGTRRMCRPGS